MTNMKTTSWRAVRAKRPVDKAAVAMHTAELQAEEHAYRLREIHAEQIVTEQESAERGKLKQPTKSAHESGDFV